MEIKDQVIIFFVIFLWSLNFVVLKYASGIISLDFFNFLRFLVFVPILFFIKKPELNFRLLILLSIGLNFLNFVFMGLALSNGLSASHASLISIPRVLFSILISYFFLSEKLSVKQFIGVFLSLLGILYLKNDIEDSVFVIGFGFLLISAFIWAVTNVYMRKNKISLSLSDTIWMNAISAPFMMIYLFFNQNFYFYFNALNLIIIILLVLFAAIFVTTYVNYYWYKLNKKYDSIVIKPLINFIPVLVLIEASLFLNEPFEMKYIFILFLLIYSLFLCNNFSFKKMACYLHFLRRHVLSKKY